MFCVVSHRNLSRLAGCIDLEWAHEDHRESPLVKDYWEGNLCSLPTVSFFPMLLLWLREFMRAYSNIFMLGLRQSSEEPKCH